MQKYQKYSRKVLGVYSENIGNVLHYVAEQYRKVYMESTGQSPGITAIVTGK